MPELAESSETESMRGNGNSEHSEQENILKNAKVRTSRIRLLTLIDCVITLYI